jgi:hypothetical protein
LRKASSLIFLALALSTGAGIAGTPAGGKTENATSTKVVTGLVTNKSGVFYITDEQTGFVFSLQSKSIGQYKGKSVTIRGTLIPAASTSNGVVGMLQVLDVKPVASTVGQNGVPAPAGIKTGFFGGTFYAVGGAAVAAGAVGGLYASGAFSNNQPASRP